MYKLILPSISSSCVHKQTDLSCTSSDVVSNPPRGRTIKDPCQQMTSSDSQNKAVWTSVSAQGRTRRTKTVQTARCSMASACTKERKSTTGVTFMHVWSCATSVKTHFDRSSDARGWERLWLSDKEMIRQLPNKHIIYDRTWTSSKQWKTNNRKQWNRNNANKTNHQKMKK